MPPMPLYEFHCKKCGKDAEILVPSTNWKGTKCPACASDQLVKKLSVFATSANAVGCDMTSSCSSSKPNGGCCGGGMCGFN